MGVDISYCITWFKSIMSFVLLFIKTVYVMETKKYLYRSGQYFNLGIWILWFAKLFDTQFCTFTDQIGRANLFLFY
jgi:hypothetical protein